MKGRRISDEELERKVRAYLKAEAGGVKPDLRWWHRAFRNLGQQERPLGLPIRMGLRVLWPVPALIGTLMVAVLAGGVSLWLMSPWHSTTTAKPAAPALPVAPVPAPRALPHPPSLKLVAAKTWAEADSYVQGQPFVLTVRLQNVTDEVLALERFPEEVALDAVDTPVDERIVITPPRRPVSLEPGEEIAVRIDLPASRSWTMLPGRYTARVAVRFNDGRELVYGAGALFILLPAQGALEKTITLEQTREVNGVAITLKRIEFTRKQTTVVALAVPEGYRPTTERGPAGAPHSSAARYRVDEGPWQELSGGNRETPEGVQLEWTLGPVSADVKTFSFALTTFDIDPSQQVAGPWEWEVLLQEGP